MALYCDQNGNMVLELLSDKEDIANDMNFLKSQNFNLVEKDDYFETSAILKLSLKGEKLIFTFQPS